MSAPTCPYCGAAAVLVTGREVYPHRDDLADKPIWRCAPCDATVGCHPGTTKPLGRPANAETRRGRMMLHEKMLDPLWLTAHLSGGYAGQQLTRQERARIRRKARSRVYAFLADRLGLTSDECHTGLFDVEMCRRAWRALQGVTYDEIREWAKKNERRDAA